MFDVSMDLDAVMNRQCMEAGISMRLLTGCNPVRIAS